MRANSFTVNIFKSRYDCKGRLPDMFITSHIIIAFLALVCCAGLVYLAKERTVLREMTEKMLNLQNELVHTKKDLESMTREHHQKYDPYSSKLTKSIILSMDRNGDIISLNDYGLQFFGYEKIDELKGKNIIGTLCAPKDKEGQDLDNLVDRIQKNPRLFTDNENENLCKNGDRKWISWTNRIVYDENGEPKEIRSVGFDITPRKRLEEELRQMTLIDPVTGVLNRRKFLEDGNKELKRARRYKRDLSVILMSIDRFNAMNSDLGPAFTDEVIKSVVDACKLETRESDYLGRLADVEFALLLPETPADGAVTVAQRIQQHIVESPLIVGETQVTIDASIGVAAYNDEDTTVDSILLRAFNAFRLAKEDHNQIAIG